MPQFGPQFRRISMKDDRGKKGRICTRESNDGGGKNPQSAPVKINVKDDVCRKAVFAHVNQMT